MLDPAKNARLMTLFAAGMERPEGERAAFVQTACPDDPLVQRELAELLRVAAATGPGVFDAPLVAEPATPSQVASAVAASSLTKGALPVIDGYEQFEPIAEGGMGTVYKAQQLRPMRRTVAIKLIKKGMDSDAVLARFEAERQALALMSHPYIATVHDAGTDSQGRPFLAMEYVPGLNDSKIEELAADQSDRMQRELHARSIPLHVIFGRDGRVLARVEYEGALSTPEKYLEFLREGLEKFGR